jgi:hypothetical protein
MRFRGTIARVGPVPPASGPARQSFLIKRGLEAARAASTSYGRALAEVDAFLGLVSLPYALDPTGVPFDLETRGRATAWDALHARLARAARGQPVLPGEQSAREALSYGVDAFRDLTATEREDAAHKRMHQYAELVSGIYGCWMKWDSDAGIWFDTCALRHAHNPYGMSVGFTATHLCSICRAEISECDHLGFLPYRVVAERYDDNDLQKCSVCHETVCGHVVGAEYDVVQWPIMRNPVIHETTITARPREPRARFSEMEMDPQPPPPKSEQQRLRCRGCLRTCSGGSSAGPDS